MLADAGTGQQILKEMTVHVLWMCPCTVWSKDRITVMLPVNICVHGTHPDHLNMMDGNVGECGLREVS